jgi:hypothetical protein
MNQRDQRRLSAAWSTRSAVARGLLVCGVVSSVLYIGTDLLAAALYPGYSYTAQQVSELSAIGAPTRTLWIVMSVAFTALVVAFGAGVWRSAGSRRSLQVTAILLVVYGVIADLWVVFAPMHKRGTVGLATDASHIVFAAVQVLVIVLFIAFGSGARGLGFRIYSIATIVTMLAAGAIPSTQVQAIAAGQPTPWMGAVERVCVYLPMLWVAVFAAALLTAATSDAESRAPTSHR